MNFLKKFFIYFLIVSLFTVLIFFKKRGIKDYIFVHKKLEKLIEENKRIEEENKKLKEKIKKLKTDLKYIEKIAREKYNMIKDDEILIKINKNSKGAKK